VERKLSKGCHRETDGSKNAASPWDAQESTEKGESHWDPTGECRPGQAAHIVALKALLDFTHSCVRFGWGKHVVQIYS
jgi:hypothetical protein